MNDDERNAIVDQAFSQSRCLNGPYCDIKDLIKGKGASEALQVIGERLEYLQRKWPDRIREVACDDDTHSGARLLFITHEDPAQDCWMGVSALYLPQYGGQPTFFFLYDPNVRELAETLSWIAAKRIAYPPEEIDDDG